MAIDTGRVGVSDSDSALVEMWRNNLRKSQQHIPGPAMRPTTMHFEWTGGGLPIVVANTDPVLLEVPYPCKIIWAHMYAGDAAGAPVSTTATVNVQMTSVLTFGASTPLHGTGAIPSLVSDSATDLSLTGWQINLVTTDTLIGRLATFSGSATWVALTLLVRPTEVQIGISGLVDGSGDSMIDADGNTIVLRS